jgi:hypothetical protein
LKKTSYKTIALLSTALILFSSLSVFPFEVTTAQGNTMNFATGEIINFHSTTTMSFWSGVSFQFGTGIILQFVEITPTGPNGMLEACDIIQLLPPFTYMPQPCEWWEVLDPQGNPTGIEFHIDGQQGPTEWHIDMVWPGPIPYPYPPGTPFWAEKKIDIVEPCDYFVVHWPVGWYPAPCTWWEIINPETNEPTGFEFHVDWTNESCEFHIDEMIPGPYILPFPWHIIEARQKIERIYPCDWFYILDPPGFSPAPCTWWEVLDPTTGAPTGLEFHIDQSSGGGTFHVDQTEPPQGFDIPMSYTVRVRRKITTIEPCIWFEVDDPTTTPKPCTWWKIVRPEMGDVEFHVDESDPITGIFHIDTVLPSSMQIPPYYQLGAEKKFVGISPCDWFRVESPNGFLPTVCSWWRITWPPEWAGLEFHIDSTDSIDKFHIDQADPLPQGPTPPPWNVTAEEFTPEDTWYWKANYGDYVPSGMPDFDQRQGGTYNWVDQWGAWSHCGPVAVANSLWWLDSEFEPNPIPPPTINDGYPLVISYGQWDDHDPQNVPPLVEHLAFLMDTDGRRTGLVHTGTNVNDMEAGLAQYLSWTGVNPVGDVNGDGVVDPVDDMLVQAALGSIPGMPNWNLAADIFPASVTYPPVADNVVDMSDLMLVASNMGMTGLFHEHTVLMPTFDFIETEVKKCQDVVLLLGYWIFDEGSGGWYREDGHYVTVAGVDSTNIKLGISDPRYDAFENGLIPEGRVPTPHVHMPPEPPYITHNDAAFVSQDIYQVAQISPPFPPCPGGNLMLTNYVGWTPSPPFFTVIEYAVVTSPLGVHDVATINLTSAKTVIGQGYGGNLTVRAQNQGDFAEAFNVVTYANNSAANTQSFSLTNGATEARTFTWNTTGFAYGNYTLIGAADIVPGETDTADNNYTCGVPVHVGVPGDVSGPTPGVYDGTCNMRDIQYLILLFNTNPTSPNWKPNADINNDGTVNMRDIQIAILNFNKHE